ncbi:MAG TPA: hypothetical protein VFK47_21340, partial [Ktedonobacteraceae bacterium]|nr:hypothetical protein [Ktedonobacteraceae bacterium]
TAIRRPFGQKKFSPLNQWDEKGKSIGKPTPGPSMGWYSWHILCASNSFVLRWCLLIMKKYHILSTQWNDWRLISNC